MVTLCFASLLCAAASERNGYALNFPGRAAIASTRRLFLDRSNTEIARLATGFTAAAWLRFDSIQTDEFSFSIALVHRTDDNFFELFGGAKGGFQFGTLVTDVVSSLGEGARCWHHYVESWDQRTGEIAIYIDGVKQQRHLFLGANATFLDHEAALFLGSKCFVSEAGFSDAYQYPECQTMPVNAASGFDGEIDDVAFYAGVLTEAEVHGLWNRPLNSTALQPVIGWSFEEVLTEAEGALYVRNIGSAGSDYDCFLGVLPAKGHFGGYFRDAAGVRFPFLAPSQVPRSSCGAPRLADALTPVVFVAPLPPDGAPLPRTLNVTSPMGANISVLGPSIVNGTAVRGVTQLADADGTPLTVHVEPLRRPVVAAGSAQIVGEDQTLEIKLWGVNPQGSAWPVAPRVVALPRQGELSEEAAPLNVSGQRVSSPAQLVAYAPARDLFGYNFDNFSYRLQARTSQ